jgi:hypothetical protein
MVRKGSPVRVRQRALTKPLLVSGFVVLDTGPIRHVAEHLRSTASLARGRPGAPADAAFGLRVWTATASGGVVMAI